MNLIVNTSNDAVPCFITGGESMIPSGTLSSTTFNYDNTFLYNLTTHTDDYQAMFPPPAGYGMGRVNVAQAYTQANLSRLDLAQDIATSGEALERPGLAEVLAEAPDASLLCLNRVRGADECDTLGLVSSTAAKPSGMSRVEQARNISESDTTPLTITVTADGASSDLAAQITYLLRCIIAETKPHDDDSSRSGSRGVEAPYRGTQPVSPTYQNTYRSHASQRQQVPANFFHHYALGGVI